MSWRPATSRKPGSYIFSRCVSFLLLILLGLFLAPGFFDKNAHQHFGRTLNPVPRISMLAPAVLAAAERCRRKTIPHPCVNIEIRGEGLKAGRHRHRNHYRTGLHPIFGDGRFLELAEGKTRTLGFTLNGLWTNKKAIAIIMTV